MIKTDTYVHVHCTMIGHRISPPDLLQYPLAWLSLARCQLGLSTPQPGNLPENVKPVKPVKPSKDFPALRNNPPTPVDTPAPQWSFLPRRLRPAKNFSWAQQRYHSKTRLPRFTRSLAQTQWTYGSQEPWQFKKGKVSLSFGRLGRLGPLTCRYSSISS